jgi:hypothetical protein
MLVRSGLVELALGALLGWAIVVRLERLAMSTALVTAAITGLTA